MIHHGMRCTIVFRESGSLASSGFDLECGSQFTKDPIRSRSRIRIFSGSKIRDANIWDDPPDPIRRDRIPNCYDPPDPIRRDRIPNCYDPFRIRFFSSVNP
jgi:hypothetical protein